MLDIDVVPIEKINPAPYNPRKDLKPGDPEYEKLAGSLDEFGCVEPLVWNRRSGHLVGGHQRLKVLKARGDTEVEVSVVDLSPEREKALNIALNRISGDWDQDKLAALLDELIETPDFDIDLTGFDLDEARDVIAEILGAGDDEEEFDVDAALEAGGDPVTKPGDLIELGPDGRHRILCGDATDPEQVRRLMNGEQAALFATDPPYMVGYDGTNHPGGKTKNKDWSGTYGKTWDDNSDDPALYEAYCRVAVDEAIRPDAAWYHWHASRRQAMLERIWNDVGAFVHCQIIWAKNRPVATRTWYLWQHEPCLMGWIKGNQPQRADQKRHPTVWHVDTLANGPERPDHPTPKPLELFEIPMRQHTKPGEICYEPFAGSGSQVIAAERLKRRCFAMEISPTYVDLIIRRYIAFVGEDAVDPAIAERYRLPNKEAAA